MQVSREQLPHNVAYYRALVKVGPGDYDVIAISRLVREWKPGFPVHTVGSFFFIHGSNATFNRTMVFHGNAMGTFLSDRNIDVWGIDLRNVQIPAVVTDLSFARDWGFNIQVPDVLLATRIARIARAITLQGMGGIIVGGHSAGAALTYAVANAEATLTKANRDIAGIVPIDMVYKLPPDAADQAGFSCYLSQTYRNFAQKGIYFFDNRGSHAWATLAQTDPNGTSPFNPTLTNLQFALGNAGSLSFAPYYPYHSFAVVRNDAGLAVAGRYTSTSDILDKIANSPLYPIPNAMTADFFAISCPAMDTPYDDNLDKINVPVFYIGNAGGFGTIAAYTTQLLGSHDITKMMIQLQPDGNAESDFGHSDPFTAEEAPQLIWQPVHQWILKHTH